MTRPRPRPPTISRPQVATFPVRDGSVQGINSTLRSSAVGFGGRQVDSLLQNVDIGRLSVAGAGIGAISTALQGGSLSESLRGALSGAASGLVAGISGNISETLQGAIGSVDAILGGGITGSLQGGLANLASNVLGDIGSQLGIQGINPGNLTSVAQSFAAGGLPGAALGGSSANATFAGTPPAPNAVSPADPPERTRTQIQDPARGVVEITVDSFLQGLQGSLSSISGLGGILGGVMQGALGQLLNSTGLSGALSGVVQGLDGALSGALAGMSEALGSAVGSLAQGLGSAISNIPGIGPAFNQLSQSVGNFANNIGNAFNALPADQQRLVGDIASGIGANFVNRRLNRPRTNPQQSRSVTNNLQFQENPAAQIKEIADSAAQLDRRVFEQTDDPVFAKLSNAANKAAQEMARAQVINANGTYGLRKQTEQERVENITKCVNGQIVDTEIENFQYGLRQPIIDAFANSSPQTNSPAAASLRRASINAVTQQPISPNRALRERELELIRQDRILLYKSTADDSQVEEFNKKVLQLTEKYGKTRADLYIDFVVGTEPVSASEKLLLKNLSNEDRISRAQRISSVTDVTPSTLIYPQRDRIYNNREQEVVPNAVSQTIVEDAFTRSASLRNSNRRDTLGNISSRLNRRLA